MDRHSLIKGYFFSGVRYGDILRVLAAHAIISEQQDSNEDIECAYALPSSKCWFGPSHWIYSEPLQSNWRVHGYTWMYTSGPWACYL